MKLVVRRQPKFCNSKSKARRIRVMDLGPRDKRGGMDMRGREKEAGKNR
jgi:hypothetical protein